MSLDSFHAPQLDYWAVRSGDVVTIQSLGETIRLNIIDHGDGRIELCAPAKEPELRTVLIQLGAESYHKAFPTFAAAAPMSDLLYIVTNVDCIDSNQYADCAF